MVNRLRNKKDKSIKQKQCYENLWVRKEELQPDNKLESQNNQVNTICSFPTQNVNVKHIKKIRIKAYCQHPGGGGRNTYLSTISKIIKKSKTYKTQKRVGKTFLL